MNRDRDRNLTLAALGIIILATLALLFSTVTDADADQPYGGCKEAGRYASSVGAQDCRDMGWKVGPGYSVSPRGVLRFYDLPTCRNEDGSGQRGACGWNVTGEGRGLVYLVVGPKDRTIYLNQCRAGVCSEWVR